jgi:hypothetical protein
MQFFTAPGRARALPKGDIYLFFLNLTTSLLKGRVFAMQQWHIGCKLGYIGMHWAIMAIKTTGKVLPRQLKVW